MQKQQNGKCHDDGIQRQPGYAPTGNVFMPDAAYKAIELCRTEQHHQIEQGGANPQAFICQMEHADGVKRKNRQRQLLCYVKSEHDQQGGGQHQRHGQ